MPLKYSLSVFECNRQPQRGGITQIIRIPTITNVKELTIRQWQHKITLRIKGA